jgi:hypothetical protein
VSGVARVELGLDDALVSVALIAHSQSRSRESLLNQHLRILERRLQSSLKRRELRVVMITLLAPVLHSSSMPTLDQGWLPDDDIKVRIEQDDDIVFECTDIADDWIGIIVLTAVLQQGWLDHYEAVGDVFAE